MKGTVHMKNYEKKQAEAKLMSELYKGEKSGKEQGWNDFEDVIKELLIDAEKQTLSREGEFLIYCIEIYKSAKNLSGKEVMELFTKYNVTDYIKNYYEALHTTGERYIVNDIDLYIEARTTV